jgi:hypothetical protein
VGNTLGMSDRYFRVFHFVEASLVPVVMGAEYLLFLLFLRSTSGYRQLHAGVVPV